MGKEAVKSKNGSHSTNRYIYSSRNLWSGILFGVGVMGFIDEVVFHQLLHWHHFYDWSTTSVGLISDGLFNAFSWFAAIAGLFLFADLRRRNGLWITKWWAGVLLGAGTFQLFDGIILHKVLRVHQIRYVENVIVYDVVWNAFAIVVIVVGVILFKRAKREKQQGGVGSSDNG